MPRLSKTRASSLLTALSRPLLTPGYQRFHPYLLQTLLKWSSKIQAVAPSVLLPSNRNAFSFKSSVNTIKSAVQLVDDNLNDKEKLITRTRVRRVQGSRVGEEKEEDKEDDDDEAEEVVDEDIFDDTDFYQQLLRDVIDSRGSIAGGGEDGLGVQKQKKVKKKVDTKASKGRKLR
jgi:protein AATF/BFR2